MIAATLFSSSSGNSFYFNDGKTSILIDAGGSSKRIAAALSSLGASLSDISAIFITHEHCDHTQGLEIISKHHKIPIHMKERCARRIVNSKNCSIFSNLFLYRDDFTVNVGDIVVTSFKTPHDSDDSCGYIIKSGSKKIGYATDCGCITNRLLENLLGSDAVVIEANHDISMLQNGPYPYMLKQRILSDYGHLSNDNSARLAYELFKNGTKSFVFAHLSKENNTPELAYKTITNILPQEAIIKIASPCEPTILTI